MRAILYLFVGSLLVPMSLNAQVADMPGEAMPSQLSYAVSRGAPDVINPSTLNVHLSIPLFKKSGPGGEIEYDLVYNSNMFSITSNNLSYDQTYNSEYPTGFGWRDLVAVPAHVGPIGYYTQEIDCYDDIDFTQPDGYAIEYTGFSLTSADYRTHQFNINYYDTSNCNGAFYSPSSIPPDASWVWSGFATDGSGYYLVPAANEGVDPGDPNYARVTGPNGLRLAINDFSVWLGSSSDSAQVDSNGDTLDTIGVAGFPQWEMQNGYLTLVYSSTDLPTIGVQVNSVTQFEVQGDHVLSNSDPTGGAPFKVLYTDSNGSQQTVAVNYGVFTFQTSFGISGVADVGPLQVQLPTSVVYPDGTSYQFSYEPTPGHPGSVTGRLNYLKTPTGETITYQYIGANNGMAGIPETNSAPYPVSLDTGPLGLIRTTSDGATSYSRNLTINGSAPQFTPWLHATTTITSPDVNHNQTVLDYVLSAEQGLVYTETKKQIFQGAASGIPLLTTIECHNGNTGDCTNEPPLSDSILDTELNITDAFSDGMSSRVDTFYNVDGLPVQVNEYDYGASSPTRSTTTTYASLVPVSDGGIFDRPSSITVHDANNNIAKKTTYGYDNYPLVVIGNYPTTGIRGNLTDIYSQIDGSGATTHIVKKYYGNGMLQSITDANAGAGTGGSITTYSYDSSYMYPSSMSVTNADGSNINGVSHTTSYVYDDNTGLLKSLTDPNNQTTSYTYDALGRITDIVTPDIQGGVHGETRYCYAFLTSSGTETSPSGCGNSVTNSIVTTIVGYPDPDIASNVAFDGFGRTIHATAAGGAITDTTYDADGNVASISNPYFSTSDPTYGITSYTYDALGRKLLQCNPDNGTTGTCTLGNSYQQWSYADNVTTFSDELRRSWKSTYDGLGRLVQVAEPGNLVTNYSYNVLDDLTNINQVGNSGAGEAPRNRSFSYNLLSQVIAALNPENSSAQNPPNLTCSGAAGTWTTCYAYDSNGNLKSKMDNRNVMTSYSYDALNRLTDKTFNDGQTPGQHFRYDQTSGWAGLQYNTIGRLSEASTDQDERYFGSGSAPACSPQSSAAANYNPTYGNPTYCNWTDMLYSYDAIGRVNRIPTAFPSEAGWAAHETDINYDLAGNMTSLRYPDGRVVTQSWDNAGRMLNSTFDNWNGQHVGYQYWSMNSTDYLADGSAKAMAFGNGIAQTYTKDDRFKLTWAGIYAGASGLNQYASSRFYYYKNNNLCASSTTADVGNIVTIHDGLNFSGSQYFCYDNLNRLSLFENDDASMMQSFSYDSFGNLKQSGTLNSQLTYNGNNQITSGGYGYDAAGNLTSMNNGVFASTYSFDADGKMFTNSAGSYYTYDANGERMRKDADSTYTEYQYLNGQPIAERHADGTWSDYIYADGQRIARADSYNRYIQFIGSFSSVGNYGEFNLTPASSQLDGQYVIQSGDKLAWRQNQSQAYGGVYLFTTDGSNGAWTLKDQNGEYGNDSMQTDGAWHPRVVDLSAFAGKTVSSIQLVAEGNSPAGNWTMRYTDLALVAKNGTVMPIYNGGTTVSGSPWGTSGYSFGGANVQTVSVATGDTIYYHGDQIGSVRMLTSSDGWPISSDTFYPFGQELNPTTDPNHYKFTGKERDQESNLDYFGARYYSNSTGRFISPDPSGLEYADPSNPQSLNLYSYVLNNPLTFIDPSGMACVWDNGSFDSEDDPSTGTPEKCSAAGGVWMDKGATASLSGGKDWSDKADKYIADAAYYISANVTPPAPGTNLLYDQEVAMDQLYFARQQIQDDQKDRSLELATGVMSFGIPKLCAAGVTASIRKNTVGLSASGNHVGANVNKHSVGHPSPRSTGGPSGGDYRNFIPFGKYIPVGVGLTPDGSAITSVSADFHVKKVGVTVYVNLGTYTPNLSDPQNCP